MINFARLKPRKLQCYILKGASRKGFKSAPRKILKKLSNVEVLSVESDDEIPSDKAPCSDAAV